VSTDDKDRKSAHVEAPFRAPLQVADADALQSMVGKPFLGLEGQALGEVVGVEAGVARIRVDDFEAYKRDLDAGRLPEISAGYEVKDEPSDPVEENATRRHTWDEFREAGMLWAVNRALHVFGWAIVIEYDDETDDVTQAYPVRTAWRGFSRASEERGYRRVSRWMERAAAALRAESDR
jgi:hypothetical protein